MIRKFRFIAGWKIKLADMIYVINHGDVKEIVRRFDAIEEQLEAMLYQRVADRYGHDVAAHMRVYGWKKWPDTLAFVEAGIEKARKALAGET